MNRVNNYAIIYKIINWINGTNNYCDIIYKTTDGKNRVNNFRIIFKLLFQVPDLDAILVPISGGGMTSGIAVAAAGLAPNCKGGRP